MTNVEIEDVLSSIRRLISDEPDKGDEAEQETAKAPDGDRGERRDEQDRLILTEALRIAENEAENEDADGGDVLPGADAAAPPVAEASEPEAVEAEEETAETPEVAEPEPQPEPGEGGPEAAEKVERVLASVSEREDDYEPEGVDVAAEYSPSPEFLRFSDAFAVSGGAANAPRAAAEPQPEEQSVQAGEAEHAEGSEAAREPDAGDDGDAMPAAREAPPEETEQPVAPEPVFAHARVETATGAGETAEPAARAEFRHAGLTEDLGDEPGEDALSDFALPIDEEALRDLIREVVRDELKGPLGERITRNLRKLVRREIHRIVTERDLD